MTLFCCFGVEYLLILFLSFYTTRRTVYSTIGFPSNSSSSWNLHKNARLLLLLITAAQSFCFYLCAQ